MNKKICVVGAGQWGRNHIRTLFKMDSLGGVVEPEKNNRRLIEKLYKGVKTYETIEDAFFDNFDGFVVATPAETHFQISKKIILSKKPVLIEKPMTLSTKDAEEIIHLAKEHNVNVMVGHVLLFHPAIQKIKEMIENNTIGKLQYIYSNRLNLGKIRIEENVFWSFAPHDIAIFQYLTNSYPFKMQASGSVFLQKGIHDSTMTNFEYENGVKGHIFVSWLHPFKEHRLVVIGSEAMISFEDSKNDKPLLLYSKKIDLSSGIPEKIEGDTKKINYEKKMPLELELKYFLKHLGSQKPQIATMDDGLNTVKILVQASQQLIK
tara:strand:- start:44131 stop:45090 length:960 start_codon:yes stop_codon:yes gene_type:complete